ncbi:DNA-binding transcriptional LysR family regulator [Bradyrhizobium niftali]|uniref:LysR family transcriptional regulator n=1 Tax=Bradyrhizobium niftali TaxID=2560055 RepID=UPI0038340DC2
MDTRFLECFVAVAESGSVAEAARRLNIAPTTLALRIRALEGELGFALVTRSGRTAKPTPAGQSLALRATGLLRDLRDLRTLPEEEQPRGQLRLGVAQTAIATVLCDVLPALAQKYPELEIVVQKGSSAQVFKKLNAAEIDGAFLFHPPFKVSKSFVWRPLRAERYVVIASAAEPVADPLQLLREKPLVRYDRSLWSGQIAANYLRQQRIRPNDRIELDARRNRSAGSPWHRCFAGAGSISPVAGRAVDQEARPPRPGSPTRARIALASRFGSSASYSGLGTRNRSRAR